jgi:hypothetical protein
MSEEVRHKTVGELMHEQASSKAVFDQQALMRAPRKVGLDAVQAGQVQQQIPDGKGGTKLVPLTEEQWRDMPTPYEEHFRAGVQQALVRFLAGAHERGLVKVFRSENKDQVSSYAKATMADEFAVSWGNPFLSPEIQKDAFEGPVHVY